MLSFVLSLFLFANLLNLVESQNATLDLIKSLPGLNFNANFKQYSGYLNANANGTWKLHYWLVESQRNASTDPLVLWLNGGPGCSSVGGFLEELGPFYPEKDGQSLYENVFSWNKVANVLFLESPIGVGFSYNSDNPSYVKANDDLVAEENTLALADFFARVHPTYKDRPFFITGESYAGIYLPTLARNLVNAINGNTFPNKHFQGMAIGNGYMNEQYLTNALILWSFYHGRVGLDTWDQIKKSCCNGLDGDNCDFYAHMPTKDWLNFNSDSTLCGNLTVPLLTDDHWPTYQDGYNFYQDCYKTNKKLMALFKAMPKLTPNNENTAQMLNYDSTDNQNGFPCWNDEASTKYLNRPDVQQALNIHSKWQNSVKKWQDCNDYIYRNYTVTYNDTSPLFEHIINNVSTPNFRILIYNGDVDLVCNFLGDAKFIRKVASTLKIDAQPRHRWFYRGQIAGYNQRYSNSNVSIDVLTVKGAGHFVPNDRGGPALQMLANFLWNNANYSAATNIDTSPVAPVTTTTMKTTTTSDSTTRKASAIVLLFLCLICFYK